MFRPVQQGDLEALLHPANNIADQWESCTCDFQLCYFYYGKTRRHVESTDRLREGVLIKDAGMNQ